MELVILHVTDVHNALERVEQLKSWLTTRKQRVDVILISGDVADGPMDWSLSDEEVKKHQNDLDAIVAGFTQVRNEVYYIPGNHDAITNFKIAEDSPNVIPSPATYPCNVHMKRTTIAPHLHLIGIGGSVPGYQKGDKIWDGFPYKLHEEMDADLHKLLDPVFFEDTSDLTAEDCVLLMTHSGPAESDTTFVREDPHNAIISGNNELMKLLSSEEMQKHCRLHIHGHSHFSPGQCVVGRTRILNPGPLQDGCFGVYTLRQRAGTHPCWEVGSVHFINLPTL
jgi:Icc-related predicted phosphoesterase